MHFPSSLPLPVTNTRGRAVEPAPKVVNLVAVLGVLVLVWIAVAYVLFTQYPSEVSRLAQKFYRYFSQDSLLRGSEL